jgi:DNA-binding response OmpR family regulator
LVELFNHYNFKTVFAENGEEGLALIKNQHPDLVITDIMMPKLNGIKMIEMLKQTKRFQHIPIIFLTAKDASDDRIIGYKTGAIDYISKPFKTDELILKAQNLFNLAESQKLNTLSKPDDESFESKSETFLQNLRIVIDQNLADSELGAETIALELNYSSSAIRKKIKRITNNPILTSPNSIKI